MAKRRKIYEGKAKILYEGPEPGTLIQYFKDDATAFNDEKRAVLDGKGVLEQPHLRIRDVPASNGIGIPTHFIKRHQHARAADPRSRDHPAGSRSCRNVAAGSLSKRLGIEEGTQLPRSIIEFYYKNDALGDPMVSEEHITAFGWATHPGDRRHHGADDPRQRLPDRPVRWAYGIQPGRLQDRVRPPVGRRHDAHRRRRRNSALTAAACGT